MIAYVVAFRIVVVSVSVCISISLLVCQRWCGGAALVFLDLGAADDDDNDEDNFCVAFVEEDVVMLLVVSSLLNSVPIASMTEYMHGPDSLSMHSKALRPLLPNTSRSFPYYYYYHYYCYPYEINISVEVRFEDSQTHS